MTDSDTDTAETEHGEQIPALDGVMEFPQEPRDDDRRWIVLFEEDYDNHAVDVEGNVGVLVDIEQTGEVLRLAAQTLAELSHKDADGDDVIRDMIDGLDEICEQEGKSRSEKLREIVADEVASHQADDDDPRIPESERLRDAYYRLRRHASEIKGAGLRITLSEAQNRLYDTQTPKDAVKDELISPLIEQNLAAVDPALERVWVVVNPLDSEPQQATAQSTDQPAVQEAD